MNTRTTTTAQVQQPKEKEEKVLRLKNPSKDSNNNESETKQRHIHWSPETVDNEHLNRKKSNSKTIRRIISYHFSLLYISSRK